MILPRLSLTFPISVKFDHDGYFVLQEVYWRIPVTLTPEQLQDFCDLIQSALDNTLELPQETVQPVESSDDEDVFTKLKSMSKVEPEIEKKIVFELPEEQSSTTEFTVQEFNLDDNQDVPNEEINDFNFRTKSKLVLESDSDDEELEKEKRALSDSDSEKPIAKRSRVIESDEED